MTSQHLRLLGFDTRLPSEDYLSSSWNEERRRLYLLRPKVAWPLSVDTLVWPSAFFCKIFGSKAAIPPEAEAEYYGYWLDLEAMRAAFAAGWKGGTTGIAIGIHLLAEDTLTSDQFGSPVLERYPRPVECPSGACLLGYDVADSGLISGLAGCGYSPGEEKNHWQAEWEHHLNEFGLLQTLEAALEFCEATDRRVPEHAPFYVFGISKLPERVASK